MTRLESRQGKLRAGVLMVLILLPALSEAAVTSRLLRRSRSHFASSDGARVHYKSFGRGTEALIFVHGWSGDMGFWREQVPPLIGKTRVVLVDLPGHGRSDKPVATYSLERFATAIDAVMRDAKISRAVLVGHSMGVPVVREFYRMYPGKTAGLVAVDGFLRLPLHDPAAVSKFIDPLRGENYKEVATRMLDGMMSVSRDRKLREEVTSSVRAPRHVLISALEAMFDPKAWKEDRIEVPLLVILAKAPFWNSEYEAFVRKLAPDVDYQVMEGVDHFLMLEKPAEFNGLLDAFLRSHRLLIE